MVADTVAAPIEQQVNGVENMLYMSSTSASDGSYTLTVTFDVGTDIDIAQVLVQNRVQIALPQLPQEVQRQGSSRKKQSTDIILFVTLTSPDETLRQPVSEQLRDDQPPATNWLGCPGVGRHQRRRRRQLQHAAVARSREAHGAQPDDAGCRQRRAEQNVQVAAGQIGQPPAPPEPAFQYTVTTLGRLTDPKQFGNIIVKSDARAGRPNHPRQGRGPRRARRADLRSVLPGQRQAGRGHGDLSAPGGQRARRGRIASAQTMEQLKSRFPKGHAPTISPSTPRMFVTAAISEVYWTLREAGVLVLIVILVFLQDWRAVLVPATTVPVTIVGAFAAMYRPWLHRSTCSRCSA